MAMPSRSFPLLLILVSALLFAANAKQSSSSPIPASSSGKAKPLQFSSPVQSYTIFDKSALSSYDHASPRRKFLPRFRAGLLAERRAKDKLMEERRSGIGFHDYEDDDGPDDTWAEASAAADERRERAMEKRVEAAHDVSVKAYDARVASKRSMNAAAKPPETAASSCKYQFVGVVNDGRGVKKTDPGDVTWYARKKPRNAKWSVRLVHVNRDAVLRELFVKGKVDVYGKYINDGLASDRSAAFAAAETAGEDAAAEEEHAGVQPSVRAKYFLKERSLWKNLNNFSPRRMFSTPSGSFWRERRITPGIYTDGTTVYESVYRYRDGKNGMKPVAKMSMFLESPRALGLGAEEKMDIVARLKNGDPPDVVVEK